MLSLAPKILNVLVLESTLETTTALPSSLFPWSAFFTSIFKRRSHYHKLMKSCHRRCIGCTTAASPESIMISLVNPPKYPFFFWKQSKALRDLNVTEKLISSLDPLQKCNCRVGEFALQNDTVFIF